jgi:hypothetical protein
MVVTAADVIRAVERGDPVGIVYDQADRFLEETCGDLCRLLGLLYESHGIGPIRVTFREEDGFMVVKLWPPLAAPRRSWWRRLLDRLCRRGD